MEKRVAVIVSVSPSEPEKVVEKSAQHIMNLDFDGLITKIVYVIDLKDRNDRRGEKIRATGVDVLERDHRRGKKAGAINDCLNFLLSSGFKPDYLVFFDVDSRPSEDFIKKCVKALEENRNAFIASSERIVINPDTLVSETLDLEYRIFNFLIKRSRFKNFNGLIGVVRGDVILKYRMDESSFAEDLDFSTKMHALGYESVFVEGTSIYEQAPVTWKDLFSQRKRWYYGGLQLFKNRHLRKNRRMAFEILSAVIAAHLVILLTPLLILSPLYILYRFRKVKKLRLVLGLAIYLLVNQAAALASLYSFMRGREIEWKGIKRVEQ